MLHRIAILYLLNSALTFAISCDLSAFKVQPGLLAESTPAGTVLTWQGIGTQQLRAILEIADGQPLIRELAARKIKSGPWVILGQNLIPDFQVLSGKRRISDQQLSPLK